MSYVNSLSLFNLLTTKPRQWVSILRLREFDTSTPEGRSKERYRRAALSSLSQGASKALTILTMLISVPLTLHYLGTERYGLWMTISSVVLMMNFADLGMGLGLMNAVSEAHGRDDRQAAVTLVSSAFFMLAGMALFIITAFMVAYPYIPWSEVFNVKSGLAIREAGPATAAFLVCFAVNLPLGIVQRVQRGYQEGYLNSLWDSGGRVLALLALLLVIYIRGGLVWLVLALAGTPALGALGNGISLFCYRRPWLLPKWRLATTAGAGKIFRLGILFFVLQFAGALSYQSHNIILTQILGPAAVTQYAVPQRLFLLLPMILGFILEALWPACAEALSRQDISWVQKAFQRAVKLGVLLSLPITIIFIFWGPEIIRLWVGKAVSPSLLLLVGLGLWVIISAAYGPYAMLLNASNILRFQISCALIMNVVGLPLSIMLVYKIGIPGVVFGTIIAQILCVLVPSFFYTKRLFLSLRAK